MRTALKEIQTAVYQTLSNDATLKGMVTGIFDFVPENQAYPYVTIGDATEVPFRTFGRNGSNTTLVLHIWSRYKGFSEGLDILAQLNSLLDAQPIAVDGYDTVYLLYDSGEPMKDPDGITRHIPARYRMVVQESG